MTAPAAERLLEHASALRALARRLVGDDTADDVVQGSAPRCAPVAAGSRSTRASVVGSRPAERGEDVTIDLR
jgi:hypothetical protein